MQSILLTTSDLQVFDIGPEGGEVEGEGELLAESEETPFECASRQKYRMMFPEPIQLQVSDMKPWKQHKAL